MPFSVIENKNPYLKVVGLIKFPLFGGEKYTF
jgi:hypothetical protein